MVRPAGFEPASEAWKASILTRLDYGRSRRETIVRGCDLRVLIKWAQLGGSVEGCDPQQFSFSISFQTFISCFSFRENCIINI
jgi:hypothetical protein